MRKRKWQVAKQHDLKLLNARALMAVKNYLDYPVDAQAHSWMIRLFKDYKNHKAKIHKAMLGAFTFLLIERYKTFPDDPPYMRLQNPPRPTKEVVKNAKIHINQIAKKILK